MSPGTHGLHGCTLGCTLRGSESLDESSESLKAWMHPLCVRVAKMVFSSSLMEANFFTIAQRRELDKEAESERKKLEIEQLNLVGSFVWEGA